MTDAQVVEILRSHRDEAESRERATLAGCAALSEDHSRLKGREEDHRLPYKRDVDRIVHSKAYARYIDKTQVFFQVDNDHITHRVLHVQLVSNFARGIAEILHLNLDLVEAIALGHDVGHPPFGHEGERALSKLSEEYLGRPFAHPHQSCRLFREIEPLNLGLNVYDGFLCHDGGLKGTKLPPRYGKSWDDHFADLEQKLERPEDNIWPATMEGCLVKLCDTVSYTGRDIEDAIQMGVMERSQVAETMLGTTNRSILSRVACDVIHSSYGKDHIELSEEVLASLKALRRSNFEHIYNHPKIKGQVGRVHRSYRILFEALLDEFECKGEQSHLWSHFLATKSEEYVSSYCGAQFVVDYISGMTDRHFVRLAQQFVLPQKVVWE